MTCLNVHSRTRGEVRKVKRLASWDSLDPTRKLMT